METNAKTEFSVATIGFDEHEKKVLQSMFGISAGRTPSFTPYTFNREQVAELVLLDYDNPRALNGWAAYKNVHAAAATVPIVAVSRRAVENVSYVLRRPVIATRLLGTLERVATDELGFQHASAFDESTTVQVATEAAARGRDALYATNLTDGIPSLRKKSPLGVNSRSSEALETAAAAAAQDAGSTVPELHTPGDLQARAAEVRALVVDDSLPVRIQMKLALAGVADRVDYAETGEEAQALLADNQYEIVFLDVILPGIDGYEVCKGIKRHPATSSTPVIMLTSNSSPADRVKGRLAGCDTYLIKPVRKAVFEEVVRDYMSVRPGA